MIKVKITRIKCGNTLKVGEIVFIKDGYVTGEIYGTWDKYDNEEKALKGLSKFYSCEIIDNSISQRILDLVNEVQGTDIEINEEFIIKDGLFNPYTIADKECILVDKSGDDSTKWLGCLLTEKGIVKQIPQTVTIPLGTNGLEVSKESYEALKKYFKESE